MTGGVRVTGDTPLRRWRLSHGVRQAELAEAWGMSQCAYSRYERGERLPYAFLERIQAKTHLSFHALLQPQAFLAEHPEFLQTGVRAMRGHGSGRYVRQRPRV